MLTLEQFKAARSVLRGVIRDTSLIHSTALSKSTGHNVYLKPENMQVTGAYKIRGAYYKISTLSQDCLLYTSSLRVMPFHTQSMALELSSSTL